MGPTASGTPIPGRIAFDTTFLIDLQRERSRGDLEGPAHRLLPADPKVELQLSATALGEFAEGSENHDDPLLRTVRELHVLLPADEETAPEYGKITRTLRRPGRLLGRNDLWIAATRLRRGLPLVTADATEFERVDALQVIPCRTREPTGLSGL